MATFDLMNDVSGEELETKLWHLTYVQQECRVNTRIDNRFTKRPNNATHVAAVCETTDIKMNASLLSGRGKAAPVDGEMPHVKVTKGLFRRCFVSLYTHPLPTRPSTSQPSVPERAA